MSQPIVTSRSVSDLRARVAEWRKAGESIGLVPTMGALHEGHLALVRSAQAENRRCIATLFVNPTQFGPNEDLAAYPRTEAADRDKLAALGVDLLFAPAASEMYAPDAATTVTVARLTDHLCGPFRPGHFAGVATVVTKLLLQSLPDAAYFGEKDYQQLQVIRRLARDLNIPVHIVGVPTVRDADGLALSSRNVRLSPDERKRARAIPAALRAGLAAHRSGGDPISATRAALSGLDIDYVGLAPFPGGPTLVVAVRAGTTRLIDNVPVDHPERAGL
jgi:pantoate--beta-alanine ligase